MWGFLVWFLIISCWCVARETARADTQGGTSFILVTGFDSDEKVRSQLFSLNGAKYLWQMDKSDVTIFQIWFVSCPVHPIIIETATPK
jgi:hypothetical protein